MSDSGKYLGYREDVLQWEKTMWEREADRLSQILDKLEEENERLKEENAQLRQQIRDVSAHPIGTYKGPIFWCDHCGSPYTGQHNHHTCQRRSI